MECEHALQVNDGVEILTLLRVIISAFRAKKYGSHLILLKREQIYSL